MTDEWSDPVVLFAESKELAPGQAIPLASYKWNGDTNPGAVLRWGFRTDGAPSPDQVSVEYLNAAGKVLKSGRPSFKITRDADGLFAVAMEVSVPADCASLVLSGTDKGRHIAMIGPVGREEFSSSRNRAFLGRTASFNIPDGQGSLQLESLVVSGEDSTPVHFAIQFYNSSGMEIMPSSETSISPILGSYVVLDKNESTSWTARQVLLPEGTSSVTVSALKSRPETGVACGLRVRTRSRSAESLIAFLEELPSGTPLIFIDSTAPPLGSGLITIRPNNMSVQYTSLGYAVVSVGYGGLNGVDRRAMDLFYQAPRDEFGEVIETLSDESRRRECLYVCSSFPSPTAAVAVDTLRRKGWKTLYEIRDDMEEFKRVGYSKWYTPEGESLICRRVDYITTVSPALAHKASALSLQRIDPKVIPNGIQPRFIDKAVPLRSLEVVERKRLNGVVGYVGHLTDAWFDWDYVLRCAEALPNNRFEIIGPGKPDSLRLPANVEYLGPQPQELLQDFTENWAVGLVPFKKSPLTRAVDPNKLFEYVAWGMRTVAAQMGSIDECPTATSYHTYEEMIAGVRDALNRPWTQHELDLAEQFLLESTWRRRAEATLEVVGL
ncbi:hypothetical protein [Brevibacterium sp. W7.2]|uniref:hypothetical protein n=1 Tax=Brevibacterium sp. W7.2 TaxID=2823518 RepID=UPI001BA8BB15|nr:hypothetical protein [Brevibacterium sp. W7.2]